MAPVNPTPVTPAEPSLKPTRKWWVAQVTALAAIAVMYLTTGDWNTEESVAAVGWLTQAVGTWLMPNDPTAGGVPPKV